MFEHHHRGIGKTLEPLPSATTKRYREGMPRDKLRSKVEDLRSALAEGATLRPEQLDSLEAALSEIDALLDEDRDNEEPESILGRLRDAEQHFEDEHSELTLMIGAVARALSGLGI